METRHPYDESIALFFRNADSFGFGFWVEGYKTFEKLVLAPWAPLIKTYIDMPSQMAIAHAKWAIGGTDAGGLQHPKEKGPTTVG